MNYEKSINKFLNELVFLIEKNVKISLLYNDKVVVYQPEQTVIAKDYQGFMLYFKNYVWENTDAHMDMFEELQRVFARYVKAGLIKRHHISIDFGNKQKNRFLMFYDLRANRWLERNRQLRAISVPLKPEIIEALK